MYPHFVTFQASLAFHLIFLLGLDYYTKSERVKQSWSVVKPSELINTPCIYDYEVLVVG